MRETFGDASYRPEDPSDCLGYQTTRALMEVPGEGGRLQKALVGMRIEVFGTLEDLIYSI
jgi:hypothetical protein